MGMTGVGEPTVPSRGVQAVAVGCLGLGATPGLGLVLEVAAEVLAPAVPPPMWVQQVRVEPV